MRTDTSLTEEFHLCEDTSLDALDTMLQDAPRGSE